MKLQLCAALLVFNVSMYAMDKKTTNENQTKYEQAFVMKKIAEAANVGSSNDLGKTIGEEALKTLKEQIAANKELFDAWVFTYKKSLKPGFKGSEFEKDHEKYGKQIEKLCKFTTFNFKTSPAFADFCEVEICIIDLKEMNARYSSYKK